MPSTSRDLFVYFFTDKIVLFISAMPCKEKISNNVGIIAKSEAVRAFISAMPTCGGVSITQ